MNTKLTKIYGKKLNNMNINNLEIGLNVIENQSLIDEPPIEQIRKIYFLLILIKILLIK